MQSNAIWSVIRRQSTIFDVDVTELFDVVQNAAHISIRLETSYKNTFKCMSIFSMKSMLSIRNISNAQFSSKSSHTLPTELPTLLYTIADVSWGFHYFLLWAFLLCLCKKKAISYFYYRCDQLICMIDRQENATVSSYAKAELAMNYRIWCLLKNESW